jgi:hypothetical protein
LIQILAYADDTDIMGRSAKMVKEVFEYSEKTRQETGLMINDEKAKNMEVTTRPTNT